MARQVKISNLSGSFTVDTNCGYPALVDKVMERLDERTEKVLPDKPDIIVLPETCDRPSNLTDRKQVLDYYQARGSRIMDNFRKTARKHACYIAYSSRLEEAGEWKNSTVIIDRKGEIAGRYDKNHLMIEENTDRGIAYGTDAPVIKCDFGTVACAICFDLNFDELRLQYVKSRPDLILFSSAYHGGLMQAYWAYSCRAHFVGATFTLPGTIISPVGKIIANTTNYFDYVTTTINLDCCVTHLDGNWQKLEAMKKKYGSGVKIDDPGYLGSVLVSCEMRDKTVKDIINEFQVELIDDYFERALSHRHDQIKKM